VPCEVYATAGIHPHDAATWESDGPALAALAAGERAVAVGEIGLDFYRNLAPEADQHAVFVAQLDLAADLAKPVVIHDREAHDAILERLRAWSGRVAAEGRLARPFGVMHCFSGDLAMARACLELGFLISIAGPVTYPKADRLAEVVRELPLDALVIETDAPYLPPQPWRGRRNEPSYLPVTAETVARLKGVPAETVAAATSDNARRLFRLPAAIGSTP
jgi:TatD DNase family protein